MSHVDNCILSFSVCEKEEERIKEVNEFFNGDYIQTGFISCDDKKLPTGWYGGCKFLETPLFIGAFNYLNIKEFMKHLEKIKWEYPEEVQLIIKEQYKNIFEILKLGDTI